MLGSGRDEPLVTQVLAPKGRGRGRGDDDRGRGRGRGRGRDGDNRGRGRGGRDGERRGGGDRRNERPRRQRQKPPARPKAPRLRPARTHRQAALKALPTIQQPLAEEVLKGGVPGVRQAIDRMNDKATAEGMPKIKREPLVALAEKLAPTLKAAEWRDRAEAAVAGIETVDLRDIRSVVVAADGAARDEETRALADQLREGLTNRVDAEHNAWRDELAQTIAEGRTVRALRLSSRPPKAGAPLPIDMAERLAAAASESLTSEVTSDRYATVIDAVAFSPSEPRSRPRECPPTRATSSPRPSPSLPAVSADRSPVRYRSAGPEAAWQGQAPNAAASAAVGCTYAGPRARPCTRRGRCSGCRRGGVTDHRSQ